MKKTIAVLLVLAVVMGGVFADYPDSTVKLQGSVGSLDPQFFLKYKASSSDTYGDAPETVSNVPLTNIGTTNTRYFAVWYDANVSVSKNVSISIAATNFSSTEGAPGPAVTLSTNTLSHTIGVGAVSDAQLGEFNVSWPGTSGLATGSYTSTVTLSYTVV